MFNLTAFLWLAPVRPKLFISLFLMLMKGKTTSKGEVKFILYHKSNSFRM